MNNLYLHQTTLIELNPSKHLLAWSCGSGKTRTSIELALKNCERVLVVCPKALKENWRREIEKWSERFDGSTVFKVVSKEEFRRDWEDLEGADGIIIDEAHFFSGITSQMHKNMVKYLTRNMVQYRWLLTATPYMSSAWNIYGLAAVLGTKWNYMSFKNKFFFDIRMGSRVIPKQREGIEEEISKLVAGLGSTVKLEDCFDVPEQNFETEYFALTAEQKKEIKAIDLSADPHIVRWTRIHQVLGGYLKGDEYNPGRKIDCDKLERVRELAEENPQMMVVSRYVGEIHAIKEVLEADGRYVGVISGDIKDKQAVLDDLKSRGNYVLIVSAGCSEGWELPECPLMVFYSYDFSLKSYIQIMGRIQRAGHIKKNTYLSLIVSGTIDEDVFKCVTINKSDFHLAIYNDRSGLPDKIQ